ncbi:MULTISPECIES: type III secretion system protein [Burkholderia]|uniref:type III secretion system protein n=1 Tax=Burkholderia TaxID=32008 RepID=UPI0007522F12|nr:MULTISPECIES: type III secretion system protein [Burkholderia]AOJ73550.1 type III secretion system protein [Burkholderia savannae]KVG38907.1 type III secretion system protein [Burkholderia sp. MSMB0265]KVG81633.1 type III secretion system protein [Burkholderia sp. MSMB2040]KVG98790.1 type III secretion system protein [Burkholderia sp. MSMB2042]KVG98971.1 type III secretion system protein [Burkholderia sp. MSMB2041]
MRSSTLRQLPDTLVPLADVLLKHEPLSQAARAERLIDDAKRRARLLVRDAERDAQGCRDHAAKTGYEAGFAFAVTQVVECLEWIDTKRQILLEHVVENVRQSLEHLLGDPGLLLHITDAIADRRACPSNRPLRVSVPNRAKRIAPAIRKRLKDTYPSVQIVLVETRSFVVEWDEEILEFDPLDAAHELSDTALSACRTTVRSMNNDAIAWQVMTDALHRLKRRDAHDTNVVDAGTPNILADTSAEQEPPDDTIASRDFN